MRKGAYNIPEELYLFDDYCTAAARDLGSIGSIFKTFKRASVYSRREKTALTISLTVSYTFILNI